MTVTIEKDVYTRIMSAVGFPVLSLEDLTGESTITDQEMQDLLIGPALQEYFKWFPIKTAIEYAASSSIEIPFPEGNIFGVIDSRLIRSENTGQKTASPFINGTLYTTNGYTSGMYGTENHYDMFAAKSLENAFSESIANRGKSFKVSVDKRNKVVRGFSSAAGKVVITWASFSYDWVDVLFSREQDVINLAQANVLEYFGALRNQMNGGLPTELNGDDFISRAKDLKEEVLTAWGEHTKVVALRG